MAYISWKVLEPRGTPLWAWWVPCHDMVKHGVNLSSMGNKPQPIYLWEAQVPKVVYRLQGSVACSRA